MAGGGRVFDGTKWEDVVVDDGSPPSPIVRRRRPPVPAGEEGGAEAGAGAIGAGAGVKVEANGTGGETVEGEIFVSVVSYRDGARCGQTLKDLFDNASDPSMIVVGVVEQNNVKDEKCLVEYCKLQGVAPASLTTSALNLLRGDTKKRPSYPSVSSLSNTDCRYYDQIRFVAISDVNAKGPSYARSLTRKLLGNEEYCMQIDSHTYFAKKWDRIAKEQWSLLNNEFGVLSNPPADVADRIEREPGGKRAGDVPRQCRIRIGAHEGISLYDSSPVNSYVRNIPKPLLSRGWSAAHSFAKCHLEEAVPYDTFAPQLFDAEQFIRFVRMWTRGYDVYTPTTNIVFHDYGPNPDGIDKLDWATRGYPDPKIQRRNALRRIKTLLGLDTGGDDGGAAGGGGNSDRRRPIAVANMGLYGLGKRRTMSQLQDFLGIDSALNKDNSDNIQCGTIRYVPFDESISPFDNLYNEPDDLDPQPEFPLRSIAASSLSFRRGNDMFVSDGGNGGTEGGDGGIGGSVAHDGLVGNAVRPQMQFPPPPLPSDGRIDEASAASPSMTIATLWLFGLFVWYATFVGSAKKTEVTRRFAPHGDDDGDGGRSIVAAERREQRRQERRRRLVATATATKTAGTVAVPRPCDGVDVGHVRALSSSSNARERLVRRGVGANMGGGEENGDKDQ